MVDQNVFCLAFYQPILISKPEILLKCISTDDRQVLTFARLKNSYILFQTALHLHTEQKIQSKTFYQ